MLAGLPQAPSEYDPLEHFALAEQRQQHVLEQLAATHVLTNEQASSAYHEALPLRAAAEVGGASSGERWKGRSPGRSRMSMAFAKTWLTNDERSHGIAASPKRSCFMGLCWPDAALL